jgi:hypothetical protein
VKKPVANKRTNSTLDEEGIAANIVTENPTVKVTQALWGFTAVVVVASIGVAAWFHSLTSRIEKLENRVEAVANWLKDPTKFPGASGGPVPSASASTGLFKAAPGTKPTGSAAPLPSSLVNVSLDPPVDPKKLPQSLAMGPPVCINREGDTMSCDMVAQKCYPKSAFHPDYWEGVRAAAQRTQPTVDDRSLFVCE